MLFAGCGEANRVVRWLIKAIYKLATKIGYGLESTRNRSLKKKYYGHYRKYYTFFTSDLTLVVEWLALRAGCGVSLVGILTRPSYKIIEN